MDFFHPLKRGEQNGQRATILCRNNREKLQHRSTTPSNENEHLGGPFMKRTLLSSPTSRLPIDLMIFLAIESSEAKVLTSEQILQWIEANIYQSAKSAFDHSTWTQMVLKQLVYNRSFYLKRSESNTDRATWAFNETYRDSVKEKLYSDIFFLKLRLFLPKINSLLDTLLSREKREENKIKKEPVTEDEKEKLNTTATVQVIKIDPSLDKDSFRFRAFKLDHPYSIVDHPSYNIIGKNICNYIQELDPVVDWSRENILTSHDCSKQKCVKKYLSAVSSCDSAVTSSGDSGVENRLCGGGNKSRRKQELVPVGELFAWKNAKTKLEDVNGNEVDEKTMWLKQELNSDTEGAIGATTRKMNKKSNLRNKMEKNSQMLAKKEAEELINELENVTVPDNLFSPLKKATPRTSTETEVVEQENVPSPPKKKRKLKSAKPDKSGSVQVTEKLPEFVDKLEVTEKVSCESSLIDTVAVNDETTLWGDYVVIGDCNESSDTEVYIDITDESDGENVIVDIDSVSLPDCSADENVNTSMTSSESSELIDNQSNMRFKENEPSNRQSDQSRMSSSENTENNRLCFSLRSSSNKETHRLIHIPSQSILSKILIRKRKNRNIRKHILRAVQRKPSSNSPNKFQSSSARATRNSAKKAWRKQARTASSEN